MRKVILILLFLHFQYLWAYSPYTTKELDELEKGFIEEINQSSQVLRNPLAIQYINKIGKSLAVHAKLSSPYFFIVKSNEINAFAGPGGYIGINSQLILASENESELAAVMAHELAHVRQHHLYSMIEHQKQMRIPMLASVLASMALGVLNPSLATGALMASMTGFNENNINFTRSKEKEADSIGIDMLIKAGFDARGMTGFFKKMQQNSRYYYTDNVPAILRTHPLDEERIAEAENRITQHILKEIPENLDYKLFKELIRNNTTKDLKSLTDYYKYQCLTNNDIACKYGQSLTFLRLNQYKKANEILKTLANLIPQNLYFEIALAETELELREFEKANTRMQELIANYPDNYALIVSYADILTKSNRYKQAAKLLLKASRRFKYDLSICQKLARAQAMSNQKGYAYFTQANCELLQGHKRNAINQLNIAKKITVKDALMK